MSQIRAGTDASLLGTEGTVFLAASKKVTGGLERVANRNLCLVGIHQHYVHELRALGRNSGLASSGRARYVGEPESAGASGTILGVFSGIGIGVLTTLAGAAVLGALGVGFRKVAPQLGRAWARIADYLGSLRERRRAAQHERRRALAIEEGASYVASVRGSEPTIVTWEGANPWTGFYYRDLERYTRDVRQRRVPPLRAFCCGAAPRLGTRRK